ncbi:hypothetical protein [Nocardia altamirensis]|nr:hypothetical protein [Nocardia altamirensis]
MELDELLSHRFHVAVGGDHLDVMVESAEKAGVVYRGIAGEGVYY